MAKSTEEIIKSKRIITDTMRHFHSVEKSEGNVSPLSAGLLRLDGLEVTSFSSQYGSESSISYVAINLAGQLSVFPSYGDYTQACVLRTYGPWWKKAPSCTKPYSDTPSSFTSEDFVEIRFHEHLYPVRVEVYETYNPGAVVRILACDEAGGSDTDRGKISWATLWSGERPKITKQRPRIFAPPLKKVNFATNLIRLEFNSTCLDYYTELDGVKLVGSQTPPLDTIYHSLPNVCFDDESWEEARRISPTKDADMLATQIANLQFDDGEMLEADGNYFTILPRELLHLILLYLDTQDRCKLAQTCRLLRDHCYDPLLYTDLNLQPFWSQISGPHLMYLIPRCDRVQRLNMSWLGGGGHINHELFRNFLEHIRDVRTLELSCCKFVNSSCLLALAQLCQGLTELNLSSCSNIDDFSVFNMLPLRRLRRLNLYRTKIDGNSLIAIIKTSPDLEHLNLGSCVCLYPQGNQILTELGNSCKKLKTLDVWRMKNINEEALGSLCSNCSLLEELDVGWSSSLNSDSGCFINLAKKCPRLRKIFLTANRTVRDCDLKTMADHCRGLEQLDILGTRSVTEDAILYILEKCTNLKFLDVSFCVGITELNTCVWRAAYPHVDIKKSFQDIQLGD